MENLSGTESTTVTSCILDSRTPILHPVVIGAADTSISLDSETTSLSDSDTGSESDTPRDVLSFGSAGHPGMGPISTINIRDTTGGVSIGPTTQFHGPVTIYQKVTSNTQNHNGNGLLEDSKPEEELDNITTIHPGNKVQEQKFSIITLIKSKNFKWVLSTCVTLAVICAVIIPIVYSMQDNNTSTNRPPGTHPGLEENNSTEPPGPTLHMYTRKDWYGKPPLNSTKPLKHPTQFAVISHTAGSFCTDCPSCSAQLRNIQTDHMQRRKYPDIGYNFLIGGDGEIYVGRGWDVANFRTGKSIEISIIGNYTGTREPTAQMVSTLSKLLEFSEKSKKLASDYYVVCHSQTQPTESPGIQVCKEVKKFSHYYPRQVTL